MLSVFALLVTLFIVVTMSLLLIGMAVSYLRTGVPTIASARAAQIKVSELMRAVGARRIYELGSGTGGWALRLAADVPDARVTGVEISPLPFLVAQLWRLFHPARARINFVLANFKHVDLSDADAVAFYLMPNANARLASKLERELRTGATVATIAFSMPGWKTERVLVADNFGKTRTYVYRMGQHRG